MGRVVLGFIAGAIAVLIFHQGIIWLLSLSSGRGVFWSMAPMQPVLPFTLRFLSRVPIPDLVNKMFWGGAWGALFPFVQGLLPGRMLWLKGLLYGWLILIVSNWLVLPLIIGNPVFAGGDPLRILNGALILGGFGLGLGLIYGLMRGQSGSDA